MRFCVSRIVDSLISRNWLSESSHTNRSRLPCPRPFLLRLRTTRYKTSSWRKSKITYIYSWPRWIISSSVLARARPHNAQVMASRSDDLPAPFGPLRQASVNPSNDNGAGVRYARKLRSSRRTGSIGWPLIQRAYSIQRRTNGCERPVMLEHLFLDKGPQLCYNLVSNAHGRINIAYSGFVSEMASPLLRSCHWTGAYHADATECDYPGSGASRLPL